MDTGFADAEARLRDFARRGLLAEASRGAYADGLERLIRVGPFGAAAGVSKLVRVRLLEPTRRDERMALPLRWEATGPFGRLFPVLDADLTLQPLDESACLLSLSGAYRPPLAAVGARLDGLVLHRAASATVRALLKAISATVAPEASASLAGEMPAPRAAAETVPWAAGEADPLEAPEAPA